MLLPRAFLHNGKQDTALDKNKSFVYVLLILLGAASYGMLSPIVKLAIQDGWNVKALTFVQVLSGAVFLWMIMLIQSRLRPALKLKPTVWLRLAAVGIFGLSLTTVMFNETLARLDASLSIVLLFQFTWITILLECIRTKRWPTRHEWTAALLIFTGTLFAVGLLERELGDLNAAGVMYGLLSAISYSLFFFLSGFLPQTLEPFAKSSVMAASSLVFVLALQGTGLGALAGSGSVPLVVWGVIMGLLGTVLPTVCMNVGIPKAGAGLAALLGSFELPVSVLAAKLMLGEPLSWWQGAGIALILAGILAARNRQEGTVAPRPGSEE